jgi:hypothetical protein
MSLSSDGFDEDVDMDEDEGEEEEVYDDELFHRIITTVNRREMNNRYRRTFSRDVGSSFDEAFEDPDAELDMDPDTFSSLEGYIDPDEELAAYANEAAIIDMADPDLEEQFDDGFFDCLSNDQLELLGLGPGASASTVNGSQEMDMS